MLNRQILKSAIARSIATIRAMPPRSLSVLTYHSVGSRSPGSLATARLAEHLEAIGRFPRMRFLDWEKKAECLTFDHACLLTFDDGYLDNFTEAAPVLDGHGIKALFFVTTGFLEGVDITHAFKNYRGLPPMSWDQVGGLVRQGHAVGLHGHTHRDFGKMSDAECADELAMSADLYRRRLGMSPNCFAYPFGQFQHRRSSLAQIASATGLRFIFTADHRLARLDDLLSLGGPALIPRLRVDAQDGPEIVEQKVQGSWDYVAAVQRLQACFAMHSLSPVLQNDR